MRTMWRSSSRLPLGPVVILALAQAFAVLQVDGQRFDRAIEAYEGALANKDAISLSLYAQSARELQGLIGKFGKLFSFAEGEFRKMVDNLEQLGVSAADGKRNPAYESIQAAIKYELKEGLVRSKPPSATRTVADLQWAFRWLSNFMQRISKIGDNESTTPAAKKAYSEVFGKKHSWVIRTAINLALRTLPRKRNLVQKLMDDDGECVNDEQLKNAKIARFAAVTLELTQLLDRFYQSIHSANKPND